MLRMILHVPAAHTYRTVGPAAPSKASPWMSWRCLLSFSILDRQKNGETLVHTASLVFTLLHMLCLFCFVFVYPT